MKASILMIVLVLLVNIANAQSVIGLSLSKNFPLAEKNSPTETNLMLSKATIIRYLEPWQKALVNDYGNIKDDIDPRYPTEPRLMIDYVLKVRSEESERFFPHGYYEEDYPIKEYDGIGSLILLLLIDNSSNSFH